MMTGRRPLKTRELTLVRKIAQFLAKRTITPNQISIVSIAFAGLSGVSLAVWPLVTGIVWQILTLLLVLLGIQGRLLCNLFDGMVAVEGGKKTPAGELFNDIPDRVSDTIIFIGLGLSIVTLPAGLVLGLILALLACSSAYIRILGAYMGAPMNFTGPMAKQHRMATVTVCTLLTLLAVSIGWEQHNTIFYSGLWGMNIGTAITCIRRTVQTYHYLENNHDD